VSSQKCGSCKRAGHNQRSCSDKLAQESDKLTPEFGVTRPTIILKHRRVTEQYRLALGLTYSQLVGAAIASQGGRTQAWKNAELAAYLGMDRTTLWRERTKRRLISWNGLEGKRLRFNVEDVYVYQQRGASVL
jgi:hypothetical protein